MALVIGTNSYADSTEATAYYAERMNSDAWASVVDADATLITATRFLDNLCIWSYDKTDEDQDLEFPRGGDTDVPDDIVIAMLEIAIEMVRQNASSFVPVITELTKIKAGSVQMDIPETVSGTKIKAGSVQMDIPETVSGEIPVVNTLTKNILSRYGNCNFGGDSIQSVRIIR